MISIFSGAHNTGQTEAAFPVVQTRCRPGRVFRRQEMAEARLASTAPPDSVAASTHATDPVVCNQRTDGRTDVTRESTDFLVAFPSSLAACLSRAHLVVVAESLLLTTGFPALSGTCGERNFLRFSRLPGCSTNLSRLWHGDTPARSS